jgi:hypothetical protein
MSHVVRFKLIFSKKRAIEIDGLEYPVEVAMEKLFSWSWQPTLSVTIEDEVYTATKTFRAIDVASSSGLLAGISNHARSRSWVEGHAAYLDISCANESYQLLVSSNPRTACAPRFELVKRVEHAQSHSDLSSHQVARVNTKHQQSAELARSIAILLTCREGLRGCVKSRKLPHFRLMLVTLYALEEFREHASS